MTAAVGRNDRPALERMTAVMLETGRAEAVPRALWEEAISLSGKPSGPVPVMGDEPGNLPGKCLSRNRPAVRSQAPKQSVSHRPYKQMP